MLSTPDFFTHSYSSSSVNMTSKVNSYGPAFLLRMILASSASVADVRPLAMSSWKVGLNDGFGMVDLRKREV